ncbi:hypothetical protein ILUMI_13107 [Ignelater luminosus]|uniref:Sm domain-containing protein n=1 Tax=Ignelater luminosus TaxID=2038154 RepID=A0A8K0CWU8_IGNLU|nr:hypothetical protein ILUMI_13107 [Ignelater luminosus]
MALSEADLKRQLQQMIYNAKIYGITYFIQDRCIGRAKVYIKCHHTKEIFANILGFDKHLNMLLKNVVVKRTAVHTIKRKKRPFKQFKLYKNIFLRGDNIIYIRPMSLKEWEEFRETIPDSAQKLVSGRLRNQILGGEEEMHNQ